MFFVGKNPVKNLSKKFLADLPIFLAFFDILRFSLSKF